MLQHYKVLDMLLDGDNVDIIYLDFTKAFNKVDLGLLMEKLRSLGISGLLGAWLGRFVMSRRQRVGSGMLSLAGRRLYQGYHRAQY